MQEYLQATEDKLPAMLRACKRSLCLHHVTLHLRARAGALLALAHALAATGRVDEAVRYADEAVARQPAPHVYQEANDHRRAAGLEPLEGESTPACVALLDQPLLAHTRVRTYTRHSRRHSGVPHAGHREPGGAVSDGSPPAVHT